MLARLKKRGGAMGDVPRRTVFLHSRKHGNVGDLRSCRAGYFDFPGAMVGDFNVLTEAK